MELNYRYDFTAKTYCDNKSESIFVNNPGLACK